jgi:hypothetical protein
MERNGGEEREGGRGREGAEACSWARSSSSAFRSSIFLALFSFDCFVLVIFLVYLCQQCQTFFDILKIVRISLSLFPLPAPLPLSSPHTSPSLPLPLPPLSLPLLPFQSCSSEHILLSTLRSTSMIPMLAYTFFNERSISSKLCMMRGGERGREGERGEGRREWNILSIRRKPSGKNS